MIDLILLIAAGFTIGAAPRALCALQRARHGGPVDRRWLAVRALLRT
jgi:hypothetical protein